MEQRYVAGEDEAAVSWVCGDDAAVVVNLQAGPRAVEDGVPHDEWVVELPILKIDESGDEGESSGAPGIALGKDHLEPLTFHPGIGWNWGRLRVLDRFGQFRYHSPSFSFYAIAVIP
jgi:hypothetical protein